MDEALPDLSTVEKLLARLGSTHEHQTQVHPAFPERDGYVLETARLPSGVGAILVRRYGILREVWAYPDHATAREALDEWSDHGANSPYGYVLTLADRAPFAAGLAGFLAGSTDRWLLRDGKLISIPR